MSFNKRYFSWDSILETKKSYTFNEFDNWICKVDAFILQDKISSLFITLYSEEDKKTRKILFDSLEEDLKFIKDLIKYIKKIRKIFKRNPEDPLLVSYLNEFRSKWEEMPDKYFKF